ncbi:facilitated trehalose transporter Tret1-like [Anticarsia gemmatalis]|uniref:facilitated trehalose transporter Tret1-like n=1 Tax=Anticarsia gemmatalis TaxID=129554 RepID=UPI003F76B367
MAKDDYENAYPEYEESIESPVNISWTPFLRQLFVVGGVWTIYFVLGLCYGAPNVFIPQIRREANSTEAVSEDMASWLTSIHGYAALLWILILPILTRKFGRKVPFLILCITTMLGYIVFYLSSSNIILLISEIMQGPLVASNMTVLILIVTEYSSPRYRGVFMTVKSTIFFCGVWVANATGTFSHWKHIAFFAFVCSSCSLTAFLWPESPSWLAMNGRFEDCAKSHHWLKGYDKESENELESLINAQKEYLRARSKRKEASCCRLRIIMETLSTKAFHKPLLLSMTVMLLYNFSGKFVCSMYSVELIKRITNSEPTAYMGMLILEAVTICSMLIGCVLSKYLKRRTLLLTSSSIGIGFLFVISLYLYLIKLAVITENKVVSLLLLTLFSMTFSCGPMILACSVYGELTPIRYRSSSLPILAIFSEILMASVLKVSPYIFKIFGLHGAFLFYGVSASVFAFLLYKYLPESKDKTLQEIENYFKVAPADEIVSQELLEDKDLHKPR